MFHTNNYGLLVYKSYEKDIEVFKINYTTEETALKILDLPKELIKDNLTFIYFMVKEYKKIVEELKKIDLKKINSLEKFKKKYSV